jgi:hypothetical protein
MGIDFATLVLEPCFAVFSIPVTIDPIKSQPGAAQYAARGIFSSGSNNYLLADGAVVSDQKTTLGIKLADFTVPPMLRDHVIIDGMLLPLAMRFNGIATYWISDMPLDGQGGATLTLRLVGQ